MSAEDYKKLDCVNVEVTEHVHPGEFTATNTTQTESIRNN